MTRPLSLERTTPAPSQVGLRILSLVLTLAAACCPTRLVDQVFLIRDADAETQALIDACRDPARADCVPLCQKVSGMSGTAFEHCEMHPDNEGYLQVHVGYQEQLACH